MTDSIRAIRCDVYSRCVGYYTPVRNWHRGKREEYRQRRMIDLTPMMSPQPDPNRTIPEPEPWTGSPGMADDVEPLR